MGMVSRNGIPVPSRWPYGLQVLCERGCYHSSLVGIAEHADSLHRGNIGMPSACAMKMNASDSSSGYVITGWHHRALQPALHPHVLRERGCYHRSLVGIAEHADSLH